MILDPEEVFADLISLRKRLNAPLPDDDFQVDLDIENEFTPGCFLIYIPGLDEKLPKKLYPFHFTACSEVMNDYRNGHIKIYRITNRTSGRFEMFNGSILELPVCEKCLAEWRGSREAVRNFSIKKFFEAVHYKTQIPEEILNQIWMGNMYPNDRYPKDWQLISTLYRGAVGHWRCEKCGKYFGDNTKQLDTHHENRFKHDTRSENLRVLCKSCHGSLHSGTQRENFN